MHGSLGDVSGHCSECAVAKENNSKAAYKNKECYDQYYGQSITFVFVMIENVMLIWHTLTYQVNKNIALLVKKWFAAALFIDSFIFFSGLSLRHRNLLDVVKE